MKGITYLERFCTSCKKRKSLVGGTSYPRFRCKECKNGNRNNLSKHECGDSRSSGVLVQQGILPVQQ